MRIERCARLETSIRDGTIRLGGGMPAGGGKLSQAEIEAVIVWFQSQWPDEIYSAGLNLNRRASK